MGVSLLPMLTVHYAPLRELELDQRIQTIRMPPNAGYFQSCPSVQLFVLGYGAMPRTETRHELPVQSRLRPRGALIWNDEVIDEDL